MGVVDITIKMDVADFQRRMESSAQQTVNAIRSSVDKAARTARREFIRDAAADINVPASAIRKATPPVKASTQSSLSASFTVSKLAISALQTQGASFSRRKNKNGGVLTWATLKLSGGNVISPADRAFTFAGRNSGKSLVAQRTASAAGKKRHSMKGTRVLWAEHPGSAMGVERLVPRATWKRVAERELNANLAAKIQAALDGASVSPSGGPD